MSHKKAFPDFDISDITIPERFIDDSWKNDSCPSFYDESRNLKLWIDNKDPEGRETTSFKRFSLDLKDEAGEETLEVLIHTDQWEEILQTLDKLAENQTLTKAHAHIMEIREQAQGLLDLWNDEKQVFFMDSMDWGNTFPCSVDEWICELIDMEEKLEDKLK